MSNNFIINQVLPILVAIITFVGLSALLYFEIFVLNMFPGQKILFDINLADVLVGLTIYLKTAIDFALLIGILMDKFPGVKNRFAIEVGTAFGNAMGTIAVLVIWYFFKEITWLLALMVGFASLVLFKLAQASLEHTEIKDKNLIPVVDFLNTILSPINKITKPVISKVIPDFKFDSSKVKSIWALFLTSFSIPFILGMDDFAGYVPLFSVVNVVGFSIGVFLGHAILNIFLFLNPKKTIEIIKNPIISVIGSIAFVGLAVWGFYEVFHILVKTYLH